MYYIYCITNKINNKTYIGQHKTSNVIDSYMGSGVVINKAFQKYGIENFSKSILAVAHTKENIDILEKVFIALYRAEGKAEYNIADGGSGCYCSGEFEKQRKQKISKASAEHWKNYTDEEIQRIKQKISIKNKGKKHPHSNETKQKISKASAEHWKKEGYREKVSKAISKSLTGKKRKNAVWNKGKSTGLKWFTNGVENKLCAICPDGFFPGRTVTEIEKQRLKTVNISRTHIVSEETKKKISNTQKKNPNRAMLGRKQSIEAKQKISQQHKGKKLSNETKNKIKTFMMGKKMSIVNGKRTWVKGD